MYSQRLCRNRRPANAMKSIAACDEIALQLLPFAALLKMNYGLFRNPTQRNRFCLKMQRASSLQSRRHQILDHFMLRINRDRLPTRQVLKVDARSEERRV